MNIPTFIHLYYQWFGHHNKSLKGATSMNCNGIGNPGGCSPIKMMNEIILTMQILTLPTMDIDPFVSNFLMVLSE